MNFQNEIIQGIPIQLPEKKPYNAKVSHAPKRQLLLNKKEKILAVENALRYFPPQWHPTLAKEFYQELIDYGRIYMYRFKPVNPIFARPLEEYPAKIKAGAAIMLMIQNNLDPNIAQHPEELITYGGNGAVFQNWIQYVLTMQYLSQMTEKQTLHIYSGHPMGLFPSSKKAPSVVVTNGMMIPNYSSQNDWEKFNALGVTQYGQMTAGSYMYIGPQGIVHGTTITLMNAFRKILKKNENPRSKIFLSAGLGGMSGAQTKAGNIVGCITVCAEVNLYAIQKRLNQGWVDEMENNIDSLIKRIKKAKANNEVVSIAYHGNVVELWEVFIKEKIEIHLGSDQTSLHNPYSGGYYPVDLSFEEANEMMSENPTLFKKHVQNSLLRHAKAIILHSQLGTYFFDYGNAFLLECDRAGAPIKNEDDSYIFPSYVQDILGPQYFDYGFGPFRWVCTSGKEKDLSTTDKIAFEVLENILQNANEEIEQQIRDNMHWIKNAEKNKMVVGSQARILYADSKGRIEIALAFNKAIAQNKISEVVLGRDHHDVSGTDSPYRETSNIYDGSQFTADMAVHNVIGDSFRGATWVSIHNGGGVGWGEVINGGFGLLLDGSKSAEEKLKNMLFYDVNNGISRRSWARNKEAIFAIKKEMNRTKQLKVTLPHFVDKNILNNLETEI